MVISPSAAPLQEAGTLVGCMIIGSGASITKGPCTTPQFNLLITEI